MCLVYIIVIYIIGFAFTVMFANLTNESLNDKGDITSYVMWPIVLPVFLIFLTIKFIKSIYNEYNK